MKSLAFVALLLLVASTGAPRPAAANVVFAAGTTGTVGLYAETTTSVSFSNTLEPVTALAITLPATSTSARYALVTVNLPEIKGSGEGYLEFVNAAGQQVGHGRLALEVDNGPSFGGDLVEQIPLKAAAQTISPGGIATVGTIETGGFASVSAILLTSSS